MSEDLKHARLLGETESRREHVAWLHGYVSAYEATPSSIARLEESILEAYLSVKGRGGSALVDQDGEMRLEVCSGGTLRLMLPWKSFEMVVDLPSEMKKLREMSATEIGEYLEVVRSRIKERP